MTPQYLYPVRKRLEMLSAIFAGGFGVFVWAMTFHNNPLAWADLTNSGALAFGQVMSLAAFVHALGVRINGHWRWSPVLRLAGMACHTMLFGWLSWQGWGQTAAYTYGWGCGLLALGTLSAGRDTWRAWSGEWKLI